MCTVQSELPPCVHLLPTVSLPQHSSLFCCLFFLSPPLCWSIRRCFMKVQQAITFPLWLISNSLALTLQIYLSCCFVPGTQVNAHTSHTVCTLNTFPLLRIFDILPPDLHICLFNPSRHTPVFGKCVPDDDKSGVQLLEAPDLVTAACAFAYCPLLALIFICELSLSLSARLFKHLHGDVCGGGDGRRLRRRRVQVLLMNLAYTTSFPFIASASLAMPRYASLCVSWKN